jgi:hypothetical protein
LREKEVDMWRAAAGDLYPMEKKPDEIPMFTQFAERGLSLPVQVQLAPKSSRSRQVRLIHLSFC